MSNKIIFTSDSPEFKIPHPIPASKSVPEWWRKGPRVIDGVETMKNCVPILDSLTAGYLITLPVDIFKRKGMDEVSVNSPISIVTEHVKSQTSFFPVPEEYEEQPHKWTNHWKITTPKGYSCLFIHPLNSPQLPFHSFSGIVDTDKHPLIINFPFVFKKDFEGVIPAGTPIIQIIPFKRDSWDLKVIDDKEFVPYEKTYEVFNPPFSWYKKYFWSKKEYR
jgi:hypothetical protein